MSRQPSPALRVNMKKARGCAAWRHRRVQDITRRDIRLLRSVTLCYLFENPQVLGRLPRLPLAFNVE
jgi:hypothetical protein